MNVANRTFRRRSQQRLRRCGMTLIELTLAISISAILLSVLTALVIQVTRAEVNMRGRIGESLAIARFTDEFREDVRSALDIELTDETADSPTELVVTLGDSSQVHYSQSGRGINRIMRQGAGVIARDRFQLPANVQAEWSQLEVNDARLIRVDLVLDPANRQLFSVVAQVGRHRRAEPTTVPAGNGQQPGSDPVDGGGS